MVQAVEIPENTSTATGGVSEFAFSFTISDPRQVAVEVTPAGHPDPVVKLRGYDFDVVGSFVVFRPGRRPAAGALVRIYRVTPIEQPVRFGDMDRYRPQANEDAFDRLVRIIQEVAYGLNGGLIGGGSMPPIEVPAVQDFVVTGLLREARDGSGWPVAEISAAPVNAREIQDLVVQCRLSPGGEWRAALSLPAAYPKADFRGVLGGETYDFRARWRAVDGEVGDWATVDGVEIPEGGFVSFGVERIGGLTPAELVALLRGGVAQGREVTKTNLQAFLRLVEEREATLEATTVGGQAIKTIILDEITQRQEGDSLILNLIELIGLVSEGGNAFQLHDTTLKVSPTETWGQYRASLQANFAATQAAIDGEQTVRASETSALASSLSNVSTTVGANTASITALASSVDGLEAQYVLAVAAGNQVAGMRLAAGGGVSSIAFYADQIGFTNGVTARYPFAIVGDEVWATSLRVDRVQAGSIITGSIQAGNITDTTIANVAMNSQLADSWTLLGTMWFSSIGPIAVSVKGNISTNDSIGVALRYDLVAGGGVVYSSPEWGDYIFGGSMGALNTVSIDEYISPGPGTYQIAIYGRRGGGGGVLINNRLLVAVTDFKTE